MTAITSDRQNVQPTGPYDSLRDFIAALEADGKLLRIPEMDQDEYEATAFAYQMIDKMGDVDSPGFLIERIKIDGKWFDGPVIGNLYGSWAVEGMVYGVENIVDDQKLMYRAVLDKILENLDEGGSWKKIKPTVIDYAKAPCKEIVITGDDVDILQFPFIQNNPADAGRYINTGSIIIEDPELGRNVGTYRCQIKGKTKIGFNPRPGQDGGRMIRAMRRQGQEKVQVAIALGVDPIVWCLSTMKMTRFGEDELEVAGGLRGKPIELVKCETSDILVPANAEMIIEGEVPLQESEDEGPYGEMYGYLGFIKRNNFFMNIKAITHRRAPYFVNSYTGITNDALHAPTLAGYHRKFKPQIPNLVDVYSYSSSPGIIILSIDKRFPGEGMAAGQVAAAGPTAKVVIVVDDDINIMDPHDVFHAMAARWQPKASIMIPQTNMSMPDPSVFLRGLSSKMIIDATQQFPEEGGPEHQAILSRDLFEEGAPNAIPQVVEKWQSYWDGFGK